MEKSIRILIVDDHPFFRQGVRFYLSSLEDNYIVEDATSGEQALELIKTKDFDLILVDMKMTGMDGISTTLGMLEHNPSLRILILTSFGSMETIQKALNAGAAGYCLKNAPPEELATAIKAVAEGGTYLGRGITPQVLTQSSNNSSKLKTTEDFSKLKATLTQREIDVLRELSKGLGNREIAQVLVVSEKTVKTHVANILQKFNVKTRTQAALLARNLLKEGEE